MYLTVRQKVKHLTKTQYITLRELCRTSKNLTNEAVYNIRQHYFAVGKYLSYADNYKLLKSSPNYKTLNSNMAQQILMTVDESFKSFFALLKLAKQGKYLYKDCRLPGYLPKDGYAALIIGDVRLRGNRLTLPYSRQFKQGHDKLEFTVPPILVGRQIKEIHIVPRSDARFFEIQYIYETECTRRSLNINNALALDLGVDNLITAASSIGKTFIIDGRRLKSINRWYNKENARLQSIKDRQGYAKKPTRRQCRLAEKRNRRVNDYISKAARMVINYCILNDIGALVVGCNCEFQRGTSIGRVNNQNFIGIPFGKLRDKLKYLCELNDIRYVEQEESYTSKASFWDRDDIPVFNK